MSTATFSHDSLPYIDPLLPPSILAAAQVLLDSEIPPEATTTPHPSLPPLPELTFPPLFQAELERVASGAPITGGIDLSRYDPGDTPPPLPVPGNDTISPLLTSAHHLTTRNTNLNLLSTFGKNAWLIHNAQLEDQLRACESELLTVKVECDNLQRLERKWREGVGKVLETEVAAEELRREVLKVRREIAQKATAARV
ncbi:breast carcinoma amplified sequence 2-domain-containing protein [Kalaharituber pfeilii]|nr:breast carcinoma amplified sequence 2-domain-containing protein [Kalaharituber pfeilii]